MTSLHEIFENRYPPEIRDELADEEDLYGSELTFNNSQAIQKGWKVKVVGIDMENGTHTVQLQSGVTRTFSNQDDVYVETS